jgi:hypothetical protein
MVETPVLFITFVRPDYARQTWDGIKAAQPKKLYFYSNKGRAEKEGEIERNEEIRTYIREINWECELYTFFRDECVNIYDSLRGAIDWLFDNEEYGIILEEDCVPTRAFFSFVDQMIVKFGDDWHVWCISGDNWLNYQSHDYDYHFSHYHFMYGWASWRNKWKLIDWDNHRIEESVKNHIFRPLFKTKAQLEFREKELLSILPFLERTKCWDYMFGLIIDQNNGLTVHPKQNLVTNIGISGFHHDNPRESIVNRKASFTSESYKINKVPPFMFADFNFDLLVYNAVFKPKPIIIRIFKKLFRIMKGCR